MSEGKGVYSQDISFTFGGKKIEEFDLIATISGDRLNRKGYAQQECPVMMLFRCSFVSVIFSKQ